MYDVLIVDDEVAILNGLKRIISWDDYGLDIAATAKNGEEAWELIQKNHYDILITDIRMPNMDGVTLLKKINTNNISIKSIIVSGYDEFSYVKEAIKLGIENYLLKPINESELSSTLLAIIEKLDNESKQEQIRKLGKDTLLDNIIYRWYDGNIERDELESRAQLLDIDLNASHYLSAIINITSNGEKKYYSVSQLKESLDLSFMINGKAYFSISPLNHVVMAASLNDNCTMATLRNNLNSFLAKWGKEQQLNWFVSIGSVVDTSQDLQHSFNDAKKVQAYEFFLPENTIVDFSGITHRLSENISLKNIRFTKLDKIFDCRNIEYCHKILDEFFDDIKCAGAFTIEERHQLLTEMLLHLFDTEDRDFWKNYGQIPDLYTIFNMQSLDDFKEFVQDAADKYILNSLQYKNDKSPITRNMITYIEQHFSEDISLKMLSYMYNFSSSYMGQTFKKETGQLFTEYLCEYRIEKAKVLLTTTVNKSRDVAEMVGFRNANYFANVFKKKTGVYPTNYKKMY